MRRSKRRTRGAREWFGPRVAVVLTDGHRGRRGDADSNCNQDGELHDVFARKKLQDHPTSG
ncbi:hypothetical protein BD413DRAFT_568497 [Trametes elegans]|nr:hypothetical protein BD413DRAFT_568497 [Trametes elegans]